MLLDSGASVGNAGRFKFLTPTKKVIRSGYPALTINKFLDARINSQDISVFSELLMMDTHKLSDWLDDKANRDILKSSFSVELQKALSHEDFSLATKLVSADIKLLSILQETLSEHFESAKQETRDIFLSEIAQQIEYSIVSLDSEFDVTYLKDKFEILKSLGLNLRSGYTSESPRGKRLSPYMSLVMFIHTHYNVSNHDGVNYDIIALLDYYRSNQALDSTEFNVQVDQQRDKVNSPLQLLMFAKAPLELKIIMTNWFVDVANFNLSSKTKNGLSILELASSKEAHTEVQNKSYTDSSFADFLDKKLRSIENKISKDLEQKINEKEAQIKKLETQNKKLRNFIGKLEQKLANRPAVSSNATTSTSKLSQPKSKSSQPLKQIINSCMELPYAKLVTGYANKDRLALELEGKSACFTDVPGSRSTILGNTYVIFSDTIVCEQKTKESRLQAVNLTRKPYKVKGKYAGTSATVRGFKLRDCTFTPD